MFVVNPSIHNHDRCSDGVAKSSSHHVPGIALYRALLRQVPRISLPEDLATPARPGWTNPILYLVRSGFRRNKNDTSPRLITSALKSGYRFLTLLTRAHDVSSPQHSEVVSFLRERQARFPPPPPPGPKKEEQQNETTNSKPAERNRRSPVPIFVKTSPPNATYPVYEPAIRPLPLAELKGDRRKVPQVEIAGTYSFLRVGKPQSHYLANFLRRKNLTRQKRITHMIALNEEARPAAATEDMWEEIIAQQAESEGVELIDGSANKVEEAEDEDINMAWLKTDPSENEMDMAWLKTGPSEFQKMDSQSTPVADKEKRKDPKKARRRVGEFEQTVRKHGMRFLANQLDKEVKDVMARAKAMIDLVREEQRLADLEKAERKERRRRAWEERTKMEQEQAGQTPNNPLS